MPRAARGLLFAAVRLRTARHSHGHHGSSATRSGFGNEFATEALPGALPIGQSNPQQAAVRPLHRGDQRHAVHGAARRRAAAAGPIGSARPPCTSRFGEIARGLIRSAPFDEAPATPNQLRWRPLPIPKEPTDFVAGLVTMGGNGDPAQQTGARHAPLRRQRVDGGSLLLRRRRRAPDRAAARRAARAHRARRAARGAGRDSASCRAA